MIALKDIQSTVTARLNASTFYTAAPAIIAIGYDGLQDAQIEAQLRTLGAVAVVHPVTRASRRDQGRANILFDTEVLVRVHVNPSVNSATGAANRNALELVQATILAVLTWPPTAGDREFNCAEEFLQYSTSDDGLHTYDLFFTKLATIN